MTWPDVEVVCLNLLSDLGYTCTALPEAERWNDLMPIIAVNRVGGGISRDGITDRALVSVVVVGVDRQSAWQAAGLVRTKMIDATASEVGGILIDYVEEAVGNAQIPDLTSDNRFVDASFFVSFREH